MYYSLPSLLPRICKFLFLAALFFSSRAHAQVAYCYDSTVINRNVSCTGAAYEPLCGCDGVTYRNYCQMYYHHGIINYQSGICEPMAIDANPNPVVLSMHFTLVLKEKGDAFLRIFDLYGRQWYYRQFYGIDKLIFDIDMDDFPTGMYFIHGQAERFTLIKPFVKLRIQ